MKHRAVLRHVPDRAPLCGLQTSRRVAVWEFDNVGWSGRGEPRRAACQVPTLYAFAPVGILVYLS